MSGLVSELQSDALNSSLSTLDILRKALVVARKLSLKDFGQWIKLELDGYQNSDVPDYRRTQGQLRAWNPYHGWQPVVASDELGLEVLKEFSNVHNSQPIGELIELVKNPELNLSLVLSPQAETYLSQFIDAKVKISVSSSSISKILQAVKNIILEWSLQLEEDGIIGESMSFSDQEKQIAQKHISEYNNCTFMNSSQQPNQLNNFNAPVGAFQNGNQNTSNVNQTIGSNNQEILQAIADLRQQIHTLTEENQDVATDALDILESEVNSPTKQTKSALFSLWGVAQGIASFANAVTAIADRFGVKFHQ
jgi:hypothetical protein